MNISVLMGEPTYFKILGGANPFTRNKMGLRKKVDRAKAIEQWHSLAKTLTQLGIDVYVIPAHEEAPGLVYPANAGFLADNGTFVLSRLIASRESEMPWYNDFLKNLGLETATVSKRFEGEADFFPFQDKMIFTFGHLEKQRFALQWGLPPWKRVYGFRSDKFIEQELHQLIHHREFIPLQLVHESYYHGDTALCSFGKKREYLIAYLPVLSFGSQRYLEENYSRFLIKVSDQDAALYAANSFYFESTEGSYLIMPEGVSASLIEQIESLGVKVVCVDVSEFWKKGGGSVKCMIGSLGLLPKAQSSQIDSFRQQHLYRE